jgi:hypothetical protein
MDCGCDQTFACELHDSIFSLQANDYEQSKRIASLQLLVDELMKEQAVLREKCNSFQSFVAGMSKMSDIKEGEIH